MSRTRMRAAFGLTALTALVACDSGPAGPGVLVASVQGEAVGGVVLEITGRGILGFEGLSDTRVYAAPVPGFPDRHRVMLIHPDDGALRFEIQVDDVDMEDPVAHVVSAAGLDNATMLASGLSVRIER